MLVGQGNRVVPGAFQLLVPVRIGILGDGLFSRPRIARQGVAGQPGLGGQCPLLHQGPDQREEACGIAPRICHPGRRSNGLPLSGQLREAVDPALRRPVGGGAVNHPGLAVFYQAHRFHGGGVRQAEEHQVRRVEKLFPLRRVLALGLVDEEELDVLPGRQAVVNLEAGGALLAVDIHLWFHGMPPSYSLRACMNVSISSICRVVSAAAGPPKLRRRAMQFSSFKAS